MGYICNEVLAEARSLGVKIQLVPDTEMEAIRDQVYAQYSQGNRSFQTPLCDLLGKHESLHDPDGWQFVGDLVGSREAILFFELPSDSTGIRFPDGYSLQRTVEQCTGFVFYVTDQAATFLLCFTDHDILLAAGSMSERLKKITSE